MKSQLLSHGGLVTVAVSALLLMPCLLRSARPACAASASAALVGDPVGSATPAISPSADQLAELRKLVRTDPEARSLFARLEASAKVALTETPNPIALIQTEGKLQQDPLKIATWKSLADMGKINALAWTYAVGDQTAPSPYAAKAKEFLLAWADTNRSKGDPIDDTNLEPLLFGYDITRGAFQAAEQAKMETYLRQVSAAETRTGIGNRVTTHNNWNSHRLKIIGLIAFLLRDKDLIAGAVSGYKKQVDINLRPDGSSLDFEIRDALHYHVYDLEPLLTLAIAARRNGIDLYGYTSPTGASLGKSVAWMMPYCDGTKTHEEYVHSTVAFDRKRGDSGDPKFKAGRIFEPDEALKMLALAAAFDPACGALERKVDGKPGARFVSWEDVVNSVMPSAPR